MTKTAIAEQFEAQGLTARKVALRSALALFRNNGGTYQEALSELNAAYADDGVVKYSSAARLLQERGMAVRSRDGAQSIEPASNKNDDGKGQPSFADKATLSMPAPSSTERSGAGHDTCAKMAAQHLPASASPSRYPGHAKRGAAAITSIQSAISRSLFDTTILPDGRSLREIRWSECPNLASKYRRLSRILMAVHNHAVPPDPNARLDTLLNEERLKDIIANVERFNDLH